MSRPEYICEYCNECFTDDPIPFPDPDDRKFGKRIFCSDDCANEAYDEVQIGRREAARECEIWGNDIDSWYR